jgi:NCS1 family nucleobase:cation symporter-1
MGLSSLSSHSVQPSKWFTRQFWELETPPASYATRDGWSNADVDVVPVEQRTWKA